VSVITRSIDLFLQRPLPFLLLALPTALVSALSSVLFLVGGGPQTYTPGVMPALGPAAALGLLVGLVALVFGIALSLAMTMAADDVRAGRSVDVRARFGQGLRRTGIAGRVLVPIATDPGTQEPNDVALGMAEVMAKISRIGPIDTVPVGEMEPITLNAARDVQRFLDRLRESAG